MNKYDKWVLELLAVSQVTPKYTKATCFLKMVVKLNTAAVCLNKESEVLQFVSNFHSF